MSFFKTSGIVLKVKNIKNKEIIYDFFSLEYGKIQIFRKYSPKEKHLDLGYIVNLEVITKNGTTLHKATNIKIISEFSYQNKGFDLVNSYLELLGIIAKKIPLGVPIPEIFSIISTVHSHKNIDSSQIILAKLKVVSILGELRVENKNPTIGKILKFIHAHNISDIMRLTGINTELEKKLRILVSNPITNSL